MPDETDTLILPPKRRGSPGTALLAALFAFLVGAALVAWLASSGRLARIGIEAGPATGDVSGAAAPRDTGTPLPAATSANSPQETAQQIGTVEGRLAMLEDRLGRIDFQASAASGNAARAEGLLIAFAARRMIDRGEPLSYVANQLRLRFANAQPKAVQTVIEFSQDPVTIDELSARLEALSPRLTEEADETSLWERARREISSLFVVHRDSSSLLSPSARIDRARLMVSSRRVSQAIEEVRRLPNAYAADTWIADAERFGQAQQALDLIETAAMLEPRRLQDASGQDVDQPSPLATPGEQTGSTKPATPAKGPTIAPSESGRSY